MEQVTQSLTATDGTRIVYHTQGVGVPVVILHGTLTTISMYQHIADLLSAHYRVVLVERRHYGSSGRGPHPSSFARQAADLAAVLAMIDEPSHILGHSFGGLVAMHAISGCVAVRRLVLYEPPVILAGPTLIPVLARIHELVADGRAADAVVESFMAISDSLPPADLLRQLAQRLVSQVPGLVADLECVTSMDTDLSRWSTVNTPTLLLTGEKTDAYGKASIKLLEEVLPNARTTILPRLGHYPDNPVPIVNASRKFFG